MVSQPAAKDASRYAAAGVADSDVELEKITALLAAELDADSAALSALDAAVEQCQHHLLDPTRATDDDARHVGLGPTRQPAALGPRSSNTHAHPRPAPP